MADVEMNGWVNTSVWNRHGETQAISIHSVKLHKAQSTPSLFPILAVMLLQGAGVGVSSWVRTEPRSWAQHLGEFLPSASPEANCACMRRGEGKETESKLLTAESTA